MTRALYALLVPLHGMLGALTLALLVHPVVFLGRSAARARRVALAAAALVVTQNALGWALYPSYRAAIKPRLQVEAPAAALVFETKEHLAFFCLVLSIGGAALLQVGGDPKVARMLLALALILGLVAAALGVRVVAADWLTSSG